MAGAPSRPAADAHCTLRGTAAPPISGGGARRRDEDKQRLWLEVCRFAMLVEFLRVVHQMPELRMPLGLFLGLMLEDDLARRVLGPCRDRIRELGELRPAEAVLRELREEAGFQALEATERERRFGALKLVPVGGAT